MNNQYNIDTNAHYFVPMRPRTYACFVSFTSSSDLEHFVECEVQPYDIKGIDHKCYLVPVDETCKHYFGKKEFYVEDFKDLLKKGYIIKKNPYSIFEYGTTSKFDAEGKAVGTGLGMYIVASGINEYNGRYTITRVENGFGLDITIPLSEEDL